MFGCGAQSVRLPIGFLVSLYRQCEEEVEVHNSLWSFF